MKILFITATRIGDAVISTGLLHYLVERHPQAKFTIACGPYAESLFAAVPGLDQIIVLDKKPFGRHWFSLWSIARRTKWDLVVDLRRSLISYLVHTKQRARLGPDDHESHRVELLSSLFSIDPPRAPKIWMTKTHQEAARKFLGDDRPVFVVAPIAARREKTWPQDSFVSLINRLTDPSHRLSQSKVVILGAEEDRDELETLASRILSNSVCTLIGCEDLLTVFAVLTHADLTLANDSGMAHLSAATGCPTVVLFGPTQPELYRPWGPNVSIVQAQAVSNGRQMEDLTEDAVYSAIETVLN